MTLPTLPTIQYMNPTGQLAPGYKPTLAKEELLRGYKTMLITRQVDERMITLQRQGTITFAMSGLGEEACAVASASALKDSDWMYPQYREAGVIFWRGFTIPQYVNHMFGNSQDLIYGRQMPNHFGSRELNVVTVSSPIGTKITHAAGCAYAMRVQKETNVAICYFGEGATSQGDFHAGLNFAAVLKSPAIFFCRNNGYAISTPCCRQFATEAGIAERGLAYGMAAYRVDGNDFFAVHDIVAKARGHCVAGNGPVLIEAMTYRMGAHSTSDDPSLYRTEGEVNKWKAQDPVLRLRLYLEQQSWWDQKQDDELNAAIAQEITEAINEAKKIERPPLSYLIEHVYFEIPQKLQQELNERQKG